MTQTTRTQQLIRPDRHSDARSVELSMRDDGQDDDHVHDRGRGMCRAAAISVGLAVAVTLPFGLAACGGESATSETSTTLSSIAPLPRGDAKSTTTENLPTRAKTPGEDDGADRDGASADRDGDGDSTDRNNDDEVPAAAKASEPKAYGEDKGAKQITALPSMTPERTPADTEYLSAVKDAGIRINDVEEQLIGAAVDLCRTHANGQPNTVVPAVAGQLIEQQRTTLSFDEATKAIENAAFTAYCRTP